MNEAKRQKIMKFMGDEKMQEVVREVLLKSFLLSRPGQDVHVLAASRLAVDFLEQGWKELRKHASVESEERMDEANIGV